VRRQRFLAILVLAASCCACARIGSAPREPIAGPAPAGRLVVVSRPTLVGGGPPGGPFESRPARLRLANDGGRPLYWTIDGEKGRWVDFSRRSGQLDPGEHVDVELAVMHAAASELGVGHHGAEVKIVDRSARRVVQTFEADLWVGIDVDEGRYLRVYQERLLPIFVWGQPPTSAWVAYHASLGINAYFGQAYEPAHDPTLLEALESHSMHAVLPWNPDVAKSRRIIAWSLPGTHPEDDVPFEDLSRAREELAQRAGWRPTLVHLGKEALHADFPAVALARFARLGQLVAFDCDPWNEWRDVGRLGFAGAALARLASAGVVAPCFAWIEASDQRRDGVDRPAPTPEQVRFQVWSAIVGGATGIGYMTHAHSPFEHARLDPTVEQELIRTNAQLSALAPVILTRAPELGMNVVEEAGVAVRSAVRQSGPSTYLFAVNADPAHEARPVFRFDRPIALVNVFDENRSIAPEGEAFRDTFAPLAAHVYQMQLADERR